MSDRIAAFVDGLGTFFIGVTMVFIALFLLIALITLLGKLVDKFENRQVKEVAVPAKIEDPKPVEVKEDELELIAVITASIAASLGTTSDQLRVRSLRQVTRRVR